MSREAPADGRELRRLLLSLTLAWALAWAAGIGLFAAIAVQLSGELRARELDSSLELSATAVYGLAWFDRDDVFHAELLLREDNLLNGDFDIWVIAPGEPTAVQLAPEDARFELSLDAIAAEVVATETAVVLDGLDHRGSPYRLRADPIFGDDDDVARAAVIVVGDPQPGQAAHSAFLRSLALAASVLGLVGLIVGASLARWSIRPLEASLRQREEFLIAAAHELRTPVAALQGVCDSASAGDEAAGVALERVSSLVSRTAQVVDDLLIFARLEAGSQALERQKLRLDLLVETCLPEESAIDLDAVPSVVDADPRLVRVAIRNLIENARTHGPCDDSQIHITVSGGTVRVEDEGVGFRPQVLAVLQQSPRLAPSSRGTGLGLAIVRRIAALHGGSLQLGNRPSGGASATLTVGRPESA